MEKTAGPRFRFIDHTSDLGVVIYGANLEELFQNAASAMLTIIFGEMPEFSSTSANMNISVTGTDLSDLMVCWLGEILFLSVTEDIAPCAIKIKSVSPVRLEAKIRTVPVDPSSILCEIKAVTYHEIKVEKKDSHWEARVIFDV
jgi:SHS2 domain-containing protein